MTNTWYLNKMYNKQLDLERKSMINTWDKNKTVDEYLELEQKVEYKKKLQSIFGSGTKSRKKPPK